MADKSLSQSRSRGLKHCPFCGSEKLREDVVLNTGGNRTFIDCMECHAQGPWSTKDAKAPELWGRRVLFSRDWLRRKIAEGGEEPSVIGAGCAVASEKPAPIPDSIVQTYQAKIERDATTIKTLRDKLVELCDRLNWKGPGRESNIEITVREARAIVKSFDQISAGVAFITDERLGGP